MAKYNLVSITREYCDKYPQVASLTIARKIAKDHPLEFTVESARSSVRSVRGSNGKQRIKITHDNASKIDPNRLPESYANDWQPYIIPKECDKILVLSDLHIPYHDIKALTSALEYGKSRYASCVLINGDLLDMHKASMSFQPDPTKRSIPEEFEAARKFLEYLRELFPDAKIIYAEGNHDARYKKYLAAKALDLFGDAYYHLEQRLKLDDLQIDFVNETRIMFAGKLSISHGHTIIRGVFAPVNTARGVFTRALESHLIGHSHKPSAHSEPTLHGKTIATWSTGCLCDLHPEYNPHVAKYEHGFAWVDVFDDGTFEVSNNRIIDGRIYRI